MILLVTVILCALLLPGHDHAAPPRPRGVAVGVEIPRATTPLVSGPLDLRDGSTRLEVQLGRKPAPATPRQPAPL